MKLAACILAFYLLVLIAIPCVDVHKACELQHIELSMNADTSHANGVDLCTPFCACNCCVSPIINQDFIIQNNLSLLLQDYNSGYTSISLPSPFTSFWQPPKIS